MNVSKTGRECTECKEFKSWSNFSRHKTGKNGYYPKCKKCVKEKYDHSKYEKKYISKLGGGVYQITTRDGMYIGQSKWMTRRVIHHKLPSNKISPVTHENFIEWKVLEYIEDPVLRLQREQYYIDKYNPELNILKS